MLDCSVYTLLLAAVGLLSILSFVLDNIWSILQAIRAILAPYFIPNEETSLVKKFGPWALVTGSTDGIGKAYSFELAKRGVNIVLVSRNEERLKNTAKEIESRFFVKTKIISADFSLGLKAVQKVREEVGKLPIDILVNNVGMMYEYPDFLTEIPEQTIADIVAINVGATTLMSRVFLEGMKRRGRGAVVNVSSASEHQPMPFIAVYAASKAYIKSLSVALRCEYRRFGVTVQHLAPFFVETKMNYYFESSGKLPVCTPNQFARYAVATLGKMDESSGYWSHGLQTFMVKLMPMWLRVYIAETESFRLRNENISIRKRNTNLGEEITKME